MHEIIQIIRQLSYRKSSMKKKIPSRPYSRTHLQIVQLSRSFQLERKLIGKVMEALHWIKYGSNMIIFLLFCGNSIPYKSSKLRWLFIKHQTICNISVNTKVRSLNFFVELPYSLYNTLVSTFLDSGYPVFWHPAKTCNFTNFCPITDAYVC